MVCRMVLLKCFGSTPLQSIVASSYPVALVLLCCFTTMPGHGARMTMKRFIQQRKSLMNWKPQWESYQDALPKKNVMTRIWWCIEYKVFTTNLLKSKAPLVHAAIMARRSAKAAAPKSAAHSKKGIQWRTYQNGVMPKKTTWFKIKRLLADGQLTMDDIRSKSPDVADALERGAAHQDR
eukprot:12421293-Karenia_brevis.AAC.1